MLLHEALDLLDAAEWAPGRLPVGIVLSLRSRAHELTKHLDEIAKTIIEAALHRSVIDENRPNRSDRLRVSGLEASARIG